MSLLWQARYFHTAAEQGQLPSPRWPEVAFAGRSNAGKSSAINALCQQKQLAFASKTPGRTQSINFFAVGGGHPAQHRHDPIDESRIKGLLVDLPGYGYASVSNRLQSHWGSLLSDYIATRGAIVGLILVTDARRPLLPLDIQLLNCFAPQGKPVHILLTKADKLNQKERALALKTAEARLAELPQLGLVASLQFFSVLKREGLEAADRVIYRWMQGEVAAGIEEQRQDLPSTAAH